MQLGGHWGHQGSHVCWGKENSGQVLRNPGGSGLRFWGPLLPYLLPGWLMKLFPSQKPPSHVSGLPRRGPGPQAVRGSTSPGVTRGQWSRPQDATPPPICPDRGTRGSLSTKAPLIPRAVVLTRCHGRGQTKSRCGLRMTDSLWSWAPALG